MDRDVFLTRVRASLRGARLPEVAGPERSPTIRFDDPVARFVDQAEQVAANVIRVAGTDEIVAAVAGVMGERQSFLCWDGLDDIAPGWDEQVARKGWRAVDATVGGGSRSADQHRIGAVTVGITGADYGIAATGTAVLAHGPGRPRSASLLVEDHILLLPVERIVHSLADAIAHFDRASTSNLVAITGPSRTGDIESILTLGVHGPRHLHIVLID